jgi:hypothetical protein
LIACRIWLLLLSLVLAASSTLTAHASACSNSTIKGTYAGTIHGQIFYLAAHAGWVANAFSSRDATSLA